MARKGRQPKSGPANPQAGASGETTSGYFRRILRGRRDLLGSRTNEPLLQMWLADHPDQKEVPNNVRVILSNVKSALRSKGRARGRQQAAERQSARAAKRATPAGVLEQLEAQIDDALALARGADPGGLEDVIALLRRARNQVVWKIGQ